MDLLTVWMWALVAGGVVIFMVGALLLAILLTARRIEAHTLSIWQVGKSIAGNTVSIWMLTRTNQVARDILATVRSIDGAVASLASKLGKGNVP